jgi:acyl-CoA thioester hydrolase
VGSTVLPVPERIAVSRFVPEVEQVTSDVPARYRGRVLPEYIDGNGHMNVARYLDVSSLGVERLMEDDLGIDDNHRAGKRTSVFTAEHHLTYLAELLLDDPLTVHPVVIARSNRSLHLITYIVDPVRGQVANAVETLAVHVSLDTRKAVPFAPEVAAVIDGLVQARRSWSWEPVGCGAIGVRASAATAT